MRKVMNINRKESSKRVVIRYFILLVIIPVISFVILQYIYLKDQIKAQIIKQDFIKVQQDQKLLETEINIIEDIIYRISAHDEIVQMLSQDNFTSTNANAYEFHINMNEYFNMLNDAKFKIKNLLLIHPREGFFHFKEKIYLEENEIYQEPWYPKTIEKKGSIYWINKEKEGYLCLAKAIIDPSNFRTIGMVYVEFYNTTLEVLFLKEKQEKVYVLNDNNEIFLTNDKQKKKDISFDVAIQGGAGTQSSDKYLYLYSSKSREGFRVIRKIMLKDMFRQLDGSKQITYIGLGLCLLLFFMYLMNIINKLTKPIKDVMNLIKDVEIPQYNDNKKQQAACYELARIKANISIILKENMETGYELTKMNQELKYAEIYKLQATINPHFIYNILTSIKYMAMEEGHQSISKLITSLIFMLRQTINRDGIQTSISKEMENLGHYMNIMDQIYEGHIDFTFDKQDELDGVIPNFILQPFVENAIFHGIDPSFPNGKISVIVYRENDNLFFEIMDNGVGIDEACLDVYTEHRNSEGVNSFTNIGINTIHKRIQLLYGDDYGVTLKRLDPKGTLVTIKLPFNELE